MLIAQDFMFASYADCTGLTLVTSVWTYRWLLVWLRFEALWEFWFIRIYLLSLRRSFWSFYRVQDPSSFCIHTSDRKTCIWCSMSYNVWLCMNEMLVHWFQFYVFLFIKFVTFSPMHTLQAYWCSLSLLCLRGYFCLDTCPLHRILLFVLGNETFPFETLSIKHRFFRLCALDFTALVFLINFAWIMKTY